MQPHKGMPRRTLVLVTLAMVMFALVLLDQFGYLGGKEEAVPSPQTRHQRQSAPERPIAETPQDTPTVQTAMQPASEASAPATQVQDDSSASWETLAHRYAVTKGLLEHRESLLQAYQKFAGPYADATATFKGIFAAGSKPGQADHYIRELIPSRIKISQLQATPATPLPGGGYMSSANLVLVSSDSTAMQQAILDLGNPDNGTLWKSLIVSVDTGRRQLRLEGQLSVLWVEAAE